MKIIDIIKAQRKFKEMEQRIASVNKCGAELDTMVADVMREYGIKSAELRGIISKYFSDLLEHLQTELNNTEV